MVGGRGGRSDGVRSGRKFDAGLMQSLNNYVETQLQSPVNWG